VLGGIADERAAVDDLAASLRLAPLVVFRRLGVLGAGARVVVIVVAACGSDQ
jgi:hypothetical protein